jgi:hypothetical protein
MNKVIRSIGVVATVIAGLLDRAWDVCAYGCNSVAGPADECGTGVDRRMRVCVVQEVDYVPLGGDRYKLR